MNKSTSTVLIHLVQFFYAVKMHNIRNSRSLKLLFNLNLALGFWIPQSKAAFKWKYLLWELIFSMLIFYNVLKIVYSFTLNYQSFFSGKFVIMFMMNSTILVKNIYLIVHRKSLLKMLQVIGSFASSPILRGWQDFEKVCVKIRKIMILNLIMYFFCYTTMILFSYKRKVSQYSELNETHHQIIDNKERHFEIDVFSLLIFASKIVDSAVALAIPIKNVAIDNIMYLFHFSVVNNLEAMRKMYQGNIVKYQKSNGLKRAYFDEWIKFHVQLKRCFIKEITSFLEYINLTSFFKAHLRNQQLFLITSDSHY